MPIKFVFWSFGNLGNLSWSELALFFGVYVFAIMLVITIIKPLNSLLLGENYAQSLGINLKRTRNFTLIATGLLTGVITAFSGPIAFIGLAVPHLTKLVFTTSNHRILLPATLPINAITSIFGAPIVIWLLVRKRKVNY